MGYTHYWQRKVGTGDRQTFQAFGHDAQRIITWAGAQGIRIAGPMGEGSPDFSEVHFALNGLGDLSHETFVWNVVAYADDIESQFPDLFDQGWAYGFTKTAYKPYDAVVTALLIRARELYGDDLRVQSDGSWADWAEGRALYEQVFGKEAPCPLVSEGVSL